MAEEIKASSIFRPPRVRPLSREGRKENDGRFREKLAELAKEGQAESGASEHRSPPEPEQEVQEPEIKRESDEGPSIGRNLDMRT